MHNRTEKDGVEYISVFFLGFRGRSAPQHHPFFDEIVSRLADNPADTGVMELFEVSDAVSKKFETLSERVSVRGGKLFLDGVETVNALSDQVVRFLYMGVDDWKPLIKFYENLLSNPNAHSREQLYEWLNTHNFTIDEDGYLIGYKYVADKGDGNYTATRSGYGIVDGVEYTNAYLPYTVGCVATMPRDKVNHDPSEGCSYGLHVGTWNYAASGSPTVLRVRVNPRDVVSVPTDCNWAKIRCCRFEVLDAQKVQIEEPLAYYGRVEADELPRLVPASEWKREHSGTDAYVDVPIDPTPDGTEIPVRTLTDYLSGEEPQAPQGNPYLAEHSSIPGWSLDGDLIEDDVEPDIEPEYCGDCGEEEDDCTCSADFCSVCGAHWTRACSCYGTV